MIDGLDDRRDALTRRLIAGSFDEDRDDPGECGRARGRAR